MDTKKQKTTNKKDGRPTIYKPEYCEMLIEHMASGLSMEAFAGVLSIARSTLYLWRETHEEFREACEIGYCKSLLFYERFGSMAMRGLLKDSAGNKLHHDTAIYCFNMKNRFNWTDRPKELEQAQNELKTFQDYIDDLQKRKRANDYSI